MATLVIDNLDEDVVACFKALADEQGVSLEAFQQKMVLDTINRNGGQLASATKSRPRNLNEALLAIPKLEGYDDEDIFAREDSVMRDIDWSE
ncbi:hypothetical protein [Psychrobacter sp. I-STPA10]|uniref:hypothetical protein n=1 Tax=Psychrobacter sp. I-STPA10 TaxID=2585769 RepID=UPI001E3105B1|nr:hypothetical protein [Psychrobacter sp. I-STPA10]